jgi:hypothetical protein
MNTTDRKLLERAAKAANLDVCWFTKRDVGGYADDVYEDIQLSEQRLHFSGSQRVWNPLQDNDDALKLAVKLKLFSLLKDGEVACEATRRAIIEAAAGIKP